MMKIKLLILMMLFSFGLSAQTSWTNVGNGLQQRVVNGRIEHRFIKTTGYAPFGISDSLDRKLNLTGGNMAGSVYFYPLGVTQGSLNPLAGTGIIMGKNSDNSNIYYESSGDATGDSNLIFESGDNTSTFGGSTEGFLFRKYGAESGGSVTDLLRINLSQLKYKAFDIYHQGNLSNLRTDLGYNQPNGFASLDASGKVPLTQINDALLGAVNYKGTYNALTNTPALPAAATTNKGYYYIVSTAGTQFGLTLAVGDWIISSGTSYGKVDNNNSVTSVAGRQGNIVLTKSDVGLGNVDNTSDANKPVSTATQTALNLKQNSLGFTPENVANKATSLASPDNTKYPTSLAVSNAIAAIPVAAGGETLGSVVARGATTTDIIKIGLGTTDPFSNLDLNVERDSPLPTPGTINGSMFISNRKAYGTQIGVMASGDTYFQSQRSAGTEVYRLIFNPSGGNVGIGTTTVPDKLTVAGNVSATAFIAGNAIISGAPTDGAISLNYNNNQTGGLLYYGGTSSPKFTVGNGGSVTSSGDITTNSRFVLNTNTAAFQAGTIFRHPDYGVINVGIPQALGDWGVYKLGTGSTFVLSTKGNDVSVPAGNLTVNQDVNISTIGKGVVIKSPDGSNWRITVSDAGALITTKL